MIEDVNVFGVFVNGALVTAALALIVQLIARRCLAAAGLYRLFWHPGLFDLCLFVIFWGIVSALIGASPTLLMILVD